MPYARKGYRKTFTRRAPARKRVPVARKSSSTMVRTVKSIVRKEIAKEIENKEICLQGTKELGSEMKIYQYFTGTITTASLAYLNPTITQSVGENGRIANSVKVKRAIMRACLVYASTALDTRQPQQPGQYQVRLFIGKLKNSIGAPVNADFDRLLRAGATVYPFNSSDCLSVCRTVNTEYWTIYYDKIHKIGMASGTTNTTSGLPNNDYQLTKYLTINCTKMFKKTLVFMDTTINTPTNNGLYMFAGIVDSMASGNSSVNPFVLLNYDLEISFEDA